MPFQKKHKLGFHPEEDQPLDRKPLTLKLRQGVRDRVVQIPGWQSELRDVIESWLESKGKSENT